MERPGERTKGSFMLAEDELAKFKLMQRRWSNLRSNSGKRDSLRDLWKAIGLVTDVSEG